MINALLLFSRYLSINFFLFFLIYVLQLFYEPASFSTHSSSQNVCYLSMNTLYIPGICSSLVILVIQLTTVGILTSAFTLGDDQHLVKSFYTLWAWLDLLIFLSCLSLRHGFIMIPQSSIYFFHS